MATLKPYSGTSVDRLTAMINQDNRSALRHGVDFTYGVPEEVQATGSRNTRVKLISLRPKRFQDAWVTYCRLDLDALDRLPQGMVELVTVPSTPFSIHQILPAINTALGLNLLPSEVEDEAFFAPQDDYPLRIIAANSLAWRPSTYRFKAVQEAPHEDILLSFALPVTELSGLFYGNS